MPRMDGIEMLKNIRELGDDVSFIVLSAHNDVDKFQKTIEYGVDGYILKPLNLKQFAAVLSKVVNQIRIKKENINFKEQLKNINDDLEVQMIERISKIYALNQEIKDSQKEVIYTISSIAEGRCKETGNHVKRVALYSEIFAKKIGFNEEDIEILKDASPMHDIGKVAIPDAILNKVDSFTFEEKEIMNSHAQLGYEMLKDSSNPLLQKAAIISHQHHEKYDGTGYPQGLKGDDIDIFGRITAIADVFDALGSNRPYKKAWEDERIFKLFEEEKGKYFDPKLVDIFFNNLNEFLKVRDSLT
jgi:putative nucleotidyltransferase with HDIG domain